MRVPASLGPREVGRRGILTWIAVAAALAGVLALVVAFRSQVEAPQAPAAASGTIGATSAPETATAKGSTTTPRVVVGGATEHPLPLSPPRSITIDAIDVQSDFTTVGRSENGTIEVPGPGPDLDKAAWYEHSPAPGQTGPSVVLGHVDTTSGPSVFFRLAELRPGNKIQVTRADGIVATFVVDGVRAYPTKSDFPTKLVYGGDLSRPTLRLVTCSNFDNETRHYLGNTVVFAHLTNVAKPRA